MIVMELARLRLHHVGVVVSDIERTAAIYTRQLGYTSRTEVIHDPVQTAHVLFLSLPDDPVYLELVSPDGPSSKLANALATGGGLHHLCYSTEDIEGSCRALRAKGAMILQTPVPAAAFPGRRIAWAMGRDRVLTELVERSLDGRL